MTYEIAERKAVPMVIALAGTSGSGKTYSALLMAAGIAGESGKVGFIDTELGRGSMYADDPDIITAMPNGKYFIKNLTEPFSPKKYSAAIKEAIEAKVDVLVIDSATHWWEGSGGCQDIAENNKLGGMPNWAMAKMEHKKLMNLLMQCPMHIIFCLRAREKSKPVKVTDKNGNAKIEIVNEGLQPIHEKNFMFEMTLSMMFSEENPGKPTITKCPKPLLPLFAGKQNLITKEIGKKLKDWSAGGASIDMQIRNLKREFRDVASMGSHTLQSMFDRLKKEDESTLKVVWTPDFAEEIKGLAKEADILVAQQIEEETQNLEPKKLFED